MSAPSTDWYIADAAEAGEIAAVILNEAGELDAWPNLHLKLGEMELRSLWGAIGGWDLSASDSVATDVLFESPDGELTVIKVAPAFVAALANLPPHQVADTALTWAHGAFSTSYTNTELAEFVNEMRAFCGDAVKTENCVLQLVTT